MGEVHHQSSERHQNFFAAPLSTAHANAFQSALLSTGSCRWPSNDQMATATSTHDITLALQTPTCAMKARLSLGSSLHAWPPSYSTRPGARWTNRWRWRRWRCRRCRPEVANREIRIRHVHQCSPQIRQKEKRAPQILPLQVRLMLQLFETLAVHPCSATCPTVFC